MSLKLPEKVQVDPKEEQKEEEVDNLPPAEEPSNVTPEDKQQISDTERIRELELKLAEERGRSSVLETKKPEQSQPQISAEEDQYYKAKAVVMNDAGTLDDESFIKKYNMDKSSVRLHYLEYERRIDQQKNQEQLAKIQAENEILSKYGKTFAKYRSDVTQAIEEAAPEVRRDPSRLAKFMERTYLALSRDEKDEKVVEKTPKAKDSKAGEPMRRIVNDFDAPSASSAEKDKGRKDEKDELEGEDLEVGRHFGIFTKSEREKYSGRYLEMNFGGGKVFRDPKRGFEQVEKK